MKHYRNRRSCAGPRGGRVILPTPCSECAAYSTCRPGAASQPWGCDSWADTEGHRVDPKADDERVLAADQNEPEPERSCYECAHYQVDCRDIGESSQTCEAFEPALMEPEPEPEPEPQVVGVEYDEPFQDREPDLGPLFVGAR